MDIVVAEEHHPTNTTLSIPQNPPSTNTGFYSRENLAQLRVKKDIQELATQRLIAQSATTTIEFPHGNKDLMKLQVKICISSGIYNGGTFWFQLDIPNTYPFHAPNVTSLTRIWHPNVDLTSGEVHLAIFGSSWRPVLSINTVIFCLQLLFVEPNPDNPRNQHAAETLLHAPEQFRQQVRETMSGGEFFGLLFEPVISHSPAQIKRKSPSLDSICRLTRDSMRIQTSHDEDHDELPCLKKPCALSSFNDDEGDNESQDDGEFMVGLPRPDFNLGAFQQNPCNHQQFT